MCKMFARCESKAEILCRHPFLGWVESCKECADHLNWPDEDRKPLDSMDTLRERIKELEAKCERLTKTCESLEGQVIDLINDLNMRG